MPSLSNGWFADRGTGRGKPVYSSGTTVVPTNGLVGGGVSSAPTAGTFVPLSPAIVSKSLLGGWFCDRAPGHGKPITAAPFVNGLVAGGVPPLNFVIDIIQYAPAADFITVATLDHPPDGLVNLNLLCPPSTTTTFGPSVCQSNRVVYKNTNPCSDLATSTKQLVQSNGTPWSSPSTPYQTTQPSGMALCNVAGEEFGYGVGFHSILWNNGITEVGMSDDGFTVTTGTLTGAWSVVAALTFNFIGPVTTPIPIRTDIVINTAGVITTVSSPPLAIDAASLAKGCNGTIVSATGTDSPIKKFRVDVYVPQNIFNDFFTVTGFMLVQRSSA